MGSPKEEGAQSCEPEAAPDLIRENQMVDRPLKDQEVLSRLFPPRGLLSVKELW
jgi:hypothetical protein